MDLQGDGNNNTRGLEEVGWLAAVFRPKFEKSHHSWWVLYVFLDVFSYPTGFFWVISDEDFSFACGPF